MDSMPQHEVNAHFNALTRGLDKTDESLFLDVVQTIDLSDNIRPTEWRAQCIDNLLDINVDLANTIIDAIGHWDAIDTIETWPVIVEIIRAFSDYTTFTNSDPGESDASRTIAIAQLMINQQLSRRHLLSQMIPTAVFDDVQYTHEVIVDYVTKHNGLTNTTLQLLSDTFADGLAGDIEDALNTIDNQL